MPHGSPDDSAAWEIWKLVVSGAVGGAISYTLGRLSEKLKSRSAFRSDRVEAACDLIRELCELSDDYWRRPGDDPIAEQLGGQISGLSHELIATLSDLQPWALTREEAINSAYYPFYEATSGGDFQVRSRSPEPERGSDIWKKGAFLRSSLRRGRAEEL